MIPFLLIVIAILAAACTVLFIVARHQVKRADQARAEAGALHEAFWDAARKAERLQTALGEQAEAEVRANEERKDLAGTTNADLVHRANGLFGMPDNTGSGNAGH
jgi:type II secretory pathway pseudopilin PulG